MADVEAQLQERLVAAINRLQVRHGSMRMDIDFVTVLHLVGQLQLALRHPANVGVSAASAREFLKYVIAQLERAEPELGPLLRAGDDPRFDQRVRPVASPATDAASAACELDPDEPENGEAAK